MDKRRDRRNIKNEGGKVTTITSFASRKLDMPILRIDFSAEKHFFICDKINVVGD